MRLFPILLLLLPTVNAAQRYYTYVGQIQTDSVLLAWGTTEGDGNTIGRESAPRGEVKVRIDGRTVSESQKNWVWVRGLDPDREYPYEVFLRSRKIGWGNVRTYPKTSHKLAFFVIGDFGNGRKPQYDVAAVMYKTLQERAGGDNPVRFVLTTGDNIYAYRVLGFFPTQSGDEDQHWEKKFFQPYEDMLRSIPFYPSLGNHDGDESESEGDLAVYLDNFFFPAPHPSRYYGFSFGGLADFFALDTTSIRTQDGRPIYEKNGAQHRWLEQALSHSRAPWKIAYFHHPPFNAGPGHGPSLERLEHFVSLLGESGVQVVFNGHEHNFQWSEKNARTHGVRYVITGAGGELRPADVRSNLEPANIAAWAPAHHFLLVEIEASTMTVHVLGPQPVRIQDKDGNLVTPPFRVTL